MKKLKHLILLFITKAKTVLNPKTIRAGITFALCTAQVSMVSADNIGNLGENALEAIKSVYSVVMQIAIPGAILAGAICILTMIFCKNDKTFQASFSWLKRIAVLVVALLLLPNILMWIIELFVDDTSSASEAVEDMKNW